MTIVRQAVRGSIVTALAITSLHCGSPGSSANDSGIGDGGPPVSPNDAGSPANDGGSNTADAAKPDAASGVDAGDAGVPTCPAPAADAGVPTMTLAAGAGPGPGGSISIAPDGAGTGRTFDGIGAISGGGGNTRLLYDYPEPYRSQVLDYLFKPGVGAALQILKVEIGGDMNSTDGSEASHMHTANDLDCGRGYEWWLMEQAKTRNPDIKLYALSWGAPGWVGGGNFWSSDMVTYLMKWLGCAKTNGFTIGYIGGWNERGYDKGWYESLHSALAASGSAVKVVGADDAWTLTTDMKNDAAFKAAVDIVGVHYPCGGDGAPATSCPANADGLALGVPLWASENGSQDLNSGAPAMIRAIVRGYLDAKMTSYINWPIVAAIPPRLPWETMGLVQANAPWSGWYEVGVQTWATAQVTQFTQPGWSFVDSASGYLGGNSANGGYVTLKSPSGGDYTVILETTTATAPQTVSFTTKGGLSSGAVHVWTTDLGSATDGDYFVHAGDVTPSGNAFWVTLPPNTITTLSTIGGQGKGTAESPSALAALLPYAESFEGYPVGTLAPTIADQSGAFEVAACGGGRGGQCLRQMSPVVPIEWNSVEYPYNTVGTDDWADYDVAVDVMLEAAGSVEILGRFNGRDYGKISQLDAYLFSVSDTGAWSIVEAAQSGTRTTLASGTATALGTMTWHHLDFSLKGAALTASLDGAALGQTTDATYGVGAAGLGVGLVSATWFNAQFDNLAITPLGPLATGLSDTLVNRATGLALDVTGGSTSDGALVAQTAPSGQASQTWQLAGDRSGQTVLLNANSGKAIAVARGAADASAAGALDQETVDGGAAERWTLEPAGGLFYRLVTSGGLAVAAASSGSSVALAPLDCTSNTQEWAMAGAPTVNGTYTIVNRATGWLVDVNAQSTTPGATVIQWPATGGTNQEWRLAAAAGGGFVLRNANSDLALGVAASSADQETPSGAPGQTWTLGPASAGYYTLTSGGGGVLASPSSTKGAQVTVAAAASGDARQEWMLAPGR
jgi:O-glycosyl hydrolase